MRGLGGVRSNQYSCAPKGNAVRSVSASRGVVGFSREWRNPQATGTISFVLLEGLEEGFVMGCMGDDEVVMFQVCTVALRG